MTGKIKPLNIVEWCVIASFRLVMVCAFIGICFAIAADPIFNRADWIGLGVMIVAHAIGTHVIRQAHKYRR